jgi:hypothetical protein
MRRDLDWSQQQAFEALRDGLKLGPKSRASYIAIDMGKRAPTLKEQEFLVDYFGKSPDDFPDEPGPTERTDVLVAALRGQTDAISALVAELRLTAAIRRATDAERQDWDAEQDQDRRTAAERRASPGKPPT